MGERYLRQRRPNVHDTRPWTPFSAINRRLTPLIAEMIHRSVTDGGRVLDYGCGITPYSYLVPTQATYVGADLAGNAEADLTLRDDGTVPGEAESYDVVLSTQVLEHVEDPATYLLESYRVLRPGGSLVLTTHGIMYHHPDPTDHWRWTCTGLVKTVEEAGFVVVERHGIMGLTATAFQFVQDASYYRWPRPLRPVWALGWQCCADLADRLSTEERRWRNGLVLGVRATKPA